MNRNETIEHIVHHMRSRGELAIHLQDSHNWLDVMDGTQALPASELLAIHKHLHELQSNEV